MTGGPGVGRRHDRADEVLLVDAGEGSGTRPVPGGRLRPHRDPLELSTRLADGTGGSIGVARKPAAARPRLALAGGEEGEFPGDRVRCPEVDGETQTVPGRIERECLPDGHPTYNCQEDGGPIVGAN